MTVAKDFASPECKRLIKHLDKNVTGKPYTLFYFTAVLKNQMISLKLQFIDISSFFSCDFKKSSNKSLSKPASVTHRWKYDLF